VRYFLDTEFIESGSGKPIHLISIGLVSDDGRELYAINDSAPLHLADDWVKKNVIAQLPNKLDPAWKTQAELRRLVVDFVGSDPDPVFWAWYADYDWVVLCQLMGRMIDLPKNWPMYCRDLKQTVDEVQFPRDMMPEQPEAEHHALADARWLKLAFYTVLPGVRGTNSVGYLNI
jgi:hypothetical protein